MSQPHPRARAPRALLLALAAVFAPAVAHAQPAAEEGTPQWVVERFYQRELWAERGDHLAGELEEFREAPTPGNELREGARVTIRPLQVGGDHAVFATTVVYPDIVEDAYLFLQRGERWQIVSYRGLALPELFYAMIDTLQAMPERTPEYERMLRTLRLVTQPDSALKAYFAGHRAEFDALGRAAAEAEGLSTVYAEPLEKDESLSPALLRIREMLRALALGRATLRDEQAPGCVLLEIGGMMDDTAGYLYAPAGCRVPRMSPEYFIYLEELAPGWYVYKTT